MIMSVCNNGVIIHYTNLKRYYYIIKAASMFPDQIVSEKIIQKMIYLMIN